VAAFERRLGDGVRGREGVPAVLRTPQVVPRASIGSEDAEDVLEAVPPRAERMAGEGAASGSAGGIPSGGARAAATTSTATAGGGQVWATDVTRRPVRGSGWRH
jgi:hypothetical protein